MDITGRTLTHGNIDVKAVCIDFCTEEQRYLDPDSHFIHIPRDLYLKFLKRKNDTGLNQSPLYIGIRNSKNPTGKKFYFGRVEPSTTTLNSHHTMCLLPKWIFNKLGMDIMDGYVDILYLPIPQSVALIKLKGSNSIYAKTDIKASLEIKLSGYNCLNIDEEFKVENTTFKVVELRNKENKIIEFGSIYNIDECNLDFEMCDEEIEKEKVRIETLRKADLEKDRSRDLQKARSDGNIKIDHKDINSNKYGQLGKKYSAFGTKVHSLKNDEEEEKEEKKDTYQFQDTGHKIGIESKKQLTRKQLKPKKL
jgi:hypothetical protein